jgi:UPF0755 protein
MRMEQKNRINMISGAGKYIITGVAIALLITGLRAWQLFGYIFDGNVKNDFVLYINKGDTYEMILDTLTVNDVLINEKAFRWVARKKDYPDVVRPGRYHFKQGMNSNELVNMLRAGLQEPLNVIFNNIRTPSQLAGVISNYLQADSASVAALFTEETAAEYGFTPETFMAMFIPNTYQFYWTTSAREFADRMKLEYDRFWNDQRIQKAASLGLTQHEVATLASIVQEETVKAEEKPRVAGVYINRIKRGMPLQADPTVKFAVGDVTLQRILFRHLEIDSPYNTYKYPGIPPGPITFPEISSLEAVLNFEDHNYYFFCAREDFSGYHNFARTNAEHSRNAERYRAALNERKIFR